MRSLAAIESGAGGPTVLHSLVTEDQPSLLSHVRCSNIDLLRLSNGVCVDMHAAYKRHLIRHSPPPN